jgi:alpha-galactosidase/6-phospho-beta-glucosidase family protein
MVVHIGGGSLVIMQSLNALLSDYPELPADTDRRIAMLEKNETTAHKPH